MKNIKFSDMILMGYQSPKSELVDFSDADYQEAANSGRFLEKEKDGMKAVFIDGNLIRIFFNGQWFDADQIDDPQEVISFFNQ